MKRISLEMIQLRLASVRRDTDDGMRKNSRTAYAEINSKRIELNTENFVIDDDGVLVFTAVQAADQPAHGETDKAKLMAIIERYYLALDRREHGGIAQDRAFEEIEQALGMRWEPGATLAKQTEPPKQAERPNHGIVW
jgi:hypothetical protein